MDLFAIDDTSKIIFSDLCDQDFCYFVITSPDNYRRYSLFKPIFNRYSMNAIIQVRKRYMFIDIYYDINFWHIDFIPPYVQTITLDDDFNDELYGIRSLTSLTQLYPGMAFMKHGSVNLLNHLRNYESIVINTVSNIISINACDDYYSKTKHLQFYGTRFMTVTWIRIINTYLQGENIHNYPSRLTNFISTMCQDGAETFDEIVARFDFFKLRNMTDTVELSKIILKILRYNNEFNTKLSRRYYAK